MAAQVLPAVIHGDFPLKNLVIVSHENKGLKLPHWEIPRLKKSFEKNMCVDSNLTVTIGTERHPTRSKDKPHQHTCKQASSCRISMLP